MHEIRLFKKTGEEKEREYTQCLICAHKCRIKEGKSGVCRTIANKGGKLYSINYGILVAQGVDPIEKKPLFHFLPGTFSYSIASPGCNFRCLGCQNADISQSYRDEGYESHLEYFKDLERVPPEDVVKSALRSNCKSIAYTYTDPAVFFDYSLDVMELAHKNGIKNVFVTNGYYTEESVGATKGLLDAANIDIKFFNDSNYRKICGGRLEPVLEAVKMFYKNGVHLEITTLLIDEYNNNPEEIRAIADFIASVDANIPWHISRFFPLYKMQDGRVTQEKSLTAAANIGKDAGLKYIYVGNIRLDGYEDTVCPSCRSLLVKREGYNILENNIIEGGKCKFCGYKIYGAF
ncbi:MAG: AmmeMemoRadiSam system radical SAM enzyme [Deltaproteobacteria bacterium]|jgi:pyruvate formate lyase activating enzyme|nr:AmmeMemoRadiSam system radical SAM enzyme [Deltaproteobacteria bacterium]MCL5879599.1 AmmeMemoRadiSam system radical SAM enzyme [Deltaproteobacteria bacterium]